MNFRYSKKIHDHFILEEGFRNDAYKDHLGNWTIGVGHYLGKSAEFANLRWTDAKVLGVLENDIDVALADAKQLFPEWETLPPNVQLALLDMSFNMGIATFRKFKQTIRLVHEGKYAEAAASASDSKWARQVPNRAKRITKLLSNQ